MPEIAGDEPLPAGELARYRQDHRAWVAADDADVPAACLIAGIVDGSLHIEQVSVHPRAARRKIGRMLLDHAAAGAAARGIRGLTLTTFAEVPWNTPYYARCGFHVLDDSELSPGMRAVRDREIAHGLYRWPRVCMRRAWTPRARRAAESYPAAFSRSGRHADIGQTGAESWIALPGPGGTNPAWCGRRKRSSDKPRTRTVERPCPRHDRMLSWVGLSTAWVAMQWPAGDTSRAGAPSRSWYAEGGDAAFPGLMIVERGLG